MPQIPHIPDASLGPVAGALLAGALALAVAALAAAALRPDLDLAVAALFLDRPGHFLGDTAAGVAGRYLLWAAPFVLLVALLLLPLARRFGLVARAPGVPARLFLVAAMLLSPYLAVHLGLKEVSHRPRPRAVAAFGGAERFRPWDRFDGSCRHDCSFPSGETALAAWTLAPASLAPPPLRAAAVAAALLFTAATAGWRMALGAHFLSDVAAALLISALAVLACRPLLRASRRGGGALEGENQAAGRRR